LSRDDDEKQGSDPIHQVFSSSVIRPKLTLVDSKQLLPQPCRVRRVGERDKAHIRKLTLAGNVSMNANITNPEASTPRKMASV